MFDTNKSCYDLHINMYFCNISVDLLSAKYYNTLIHIIMLSFNIYPKKLHFKQPAGTSRGIYTTRNIWYLTVTDTSRPHAMGFGEDYLRLPLTPMEEKNRVRLLEEMRKQKIIG